MSSILSITDLGPLQSFILQNPVLFSVLLIWTLIWKAIGLWKSARLSHKWWFISIFFLNTLGVLEIGYIYFVAKKYDVKVESDEANK
ncbi:MAG TPA: DUF5652 family protein [Candidatus Paceibacterota bacterium]